MGNGSLSAPLANKDSLLVHYIVGIVMEENDGFRRGGQDRSVLSGPRTRWGRRRSLSHGSRSNNGAHAGMEAARGGEGREGPALPPLPRLGAC